MKHNSNVPAFLTKLWTLVEDADTNEFICWSQEGNSFMVLDEQRFAKEILPKFFKHNNMASFIRQLNMYGFRKVLHIDTGIVKQERDGPVEFHHPYFKHGQDELLENIKRKVSNARPEENKIRQTDLTNILATVQSVHCKQEDIDVRLATLKRENEALWTEISDLRQKHSHQQQLIKKLIHFLLTLVQNNRILNLKRKRPFLMNSNGKKSKYIQELYDDKPSVNGLNNVTSSDNSEDVIICDFTDVVDADLLSEAAQGSSKGYDHSDVEIVEVNLNSGGLPAEMEVSTAYTEPSTQSQPSPVKSTPISAALQLNKQCALSQEDPVKLMDYILKENGAISQNISLLGKLELMDYLDSIDCSLEDFQAMLGKPFGVDHEESVGSKQSTGLLDQSKTEVNTDKQLIQYTSCPLMAFLDGCSAPPDLDLASGPSSTSMSNQQEAIITPAEQVDKLPSELLDCVDSVQPRHSSLIRLEPLTEAEASEETLFYLCELSPGLEADSTPVEAM
ncbi:heat shock factor protein 2 isoform X2 [Boleophthalmus pectinirostris]|uniref:heat shock factor protein 2 isoform X2 n=1 Tax=Boleophthalmus pectinirostris TaxID=150288 RepID=UPI00242DF501|nr:heat shock factor protein 2 isoform X2 [Boleophthalmus pectinirostris]